MNIEVIKKINSPCPFFLNCVNVKENILSKYKQMFWSRLVQRV